MSLHDQFANSRKKLLTAARAQDARTRGILRTSIVGINTTVLAGKKPDRKHPYGYGRVVHRGLNSSQLTS